jgi:MOSC domain-containing protein YiiM
METVNHATLQELEAGLAEVRRSPKNDGRLEMIVRRPRIDEREMVEQAELDLLEGLVGDNWRARGSSAMPEGSAHPDAQITIMNSRAAALLAHSKERWQLAGDQLFIDLDLGAENLPAGTRLAIGSSVLEVTAKAHTGCKKFVGRYGLEATEFVNSELGRQLHLRGINARVIRPGRIRLGELVRKA